MKLICDNNSNNLRILDDDGRDITKDLMVIKGQLSFEYNQPIKLLLECYPNEIEFTVDKSRITKETRE